MNGADVLVRMLVAYDVRYVFGVPGDTNVALYAALDTLRDSITHVMAREERSAGYMADAYARVSNRVGVVEVPSGAGATYVLPAIAEAQGSSLPIVLITSDTPLSGEGRGVITELDCAKLFETVTKASVLIKSAAKIPETIRRAFRIATTGKPGAVHLAIPEDVLHETVEIDLAMLYGEPECRRSPAHPPRPTRQEIESLASLIANAKRPLIVAGGGVNRARAGRALTTIAEHWHLPVVTTITGQNAILDTHPLSIGIVGDNGFHPHANRAMEEADLLVYIGSRIGSVVSVGWTFPTPRPERKIAQVDIDSIVLGNTSENVLSIVSDARIVLEELNDLERPPATRRDSAWLSSLADWRERFWKSVSVEMALADNSPLKPAYVIEALNRRLVGACNLFADPGTPTPYLNRFLRLNHPDSALFIPRAFGGLGYAIPAVIGGWLAAPQVRPIGLFGDGSLGMAVGELESVARLGVPAILLSFNNSCFGWIKALQHLHSEKRYMSVDFSDVDGSALASVYGLKAFRVESPAALENALDQAFASAGPVFIDIVVESIADVIPPVYNWLKKSGADPLAVGGLPLRYPSSTRESTDSIEDRTETVGS